MGEGFFRLEVGGGESRIIHVGRPVCAKCGKEIKDRSIIFSTWKSYNDMELTELCFPCAADPKNRPPCLPNWRESFGEAKIERFVPKGAQPHFFLCPEYCAGTISSFDAARSNKGIAAESFGAKVQDMTRLAGRADATFLDDNAPVLLGADVQEDLAARDRELSTDDGLALLDDLFNAKPVLTETEKKLLEDQSQGGRS